MIENTYIIKETIISVIINLIVSFAVAFAVFHGRKLIDIFGPSGISMDAIPQSIGIVFVNTLVITLMTRNRVRQGLVAPQSRSTFRLPRPALLRALVVAFATAAISLVVQFGVVFRLTPPVWTFPVVLIYKSFWGALLCLATTPFVVAAGLSDPRPELKVSAPLS